MKLPDETTRVFLHRWGSSLDSIVLNMYNNTEIAYDEVSSQNIASENTFIALLRQLEAVFVDLGVLSAVFRPRKSSD